MMKFFWGLTMMIIPIVIAGLIIMQFVITNQMAGAGDTLGEMEQQISAFSSENQVLNEQVAMSGSLSVIEKQAVSVGFIKTTSYLPILMDQPVALR
jgi:hypothetical protein